MSERDPRDAPRPDAPDASGPRRPRSPDHRPTWFVLLGLLTLAYGGQMLVSSVETFRDPTKVEALSKAVALTPAEDALARQIDQARARVAATHARSMRIAAVGGIPVALLLLFAAAAALSRDRRGRALTLAAAWAGIAYHVATLWFTIPFARDLGREAAPPIAQLRAMQARPADPQLSAEAFAKAIAASPIVVAALASAGSLVLIRYFGGRRGRVLYGLEPAPAGGKP